MRLAILPGIGGGRALALGAVLVFGAAILGSTSRDATPAADTIASTQPVVMEPPGGPILWGITSTQIEVPLAGTPYSVRHARGTGALIRFELARRCAGGDIEIVRTAPGPRTVTHRDATLALTAYVPDGSYELTVACERQRGETTRLQITSRAPR